MPGSNSYPIDRPDSAAYAQLVADCRARLARDGMFELPGFLRTETTRPAVAAAAPAMDGQSFRHARVHNIYFQDHVEGLADDHPALARVETVHHTLNGEQLERNPILDLYEDSRFSAFLAQTMQKEAIYPMADSIARVNVRFSREGEALNWHFDRSEFTTTILLQSPEEGGELEYRQDLRKPDDANYDGVAAVLRAEDPDVRKHALKEGALNAFRGVNTLHRVAPIKGSRPRLVAIFSFYDRPGIVMTPTEQSGFYGRTTARPATVRQVGTEARRCLQPFFSRINVYT